MQSAKPWQVPWKLQSAFLLQIVVEESKHDACVAVQDPCEPVQSVLLVQILLVEPEHTAWLSGVHGDVSKQSVFPVHAAPTPPPTSPLTGPPPLQAGHWWESAWNFSSQ